MKLITIFDKLPDRIKSHVANENFIGAIKTTHKPNSTIPILWLVVLKEGLSLCSTHRDRGVYKTFSKLDINSIKIDKGSPFSIAKIIIILQDQSLDDLEITLSEKVNFNELRLLLDSLGYQVI